MVAGLRCVFMLCFIAFVAGESQLLKELGIKESEFGEGITSLLSKFSDKKTLEESKALFENVLSGIGSSQSTDQLGSVKVKQVRDMMNVDSILELANSFGVENSQILDALKGVGVSPLSAHSKLSNTLSQLKGVFSNFKDDESLQDVVAKFLDQEGAGVVEKITEAVDPIVNTIKEIDVKSLVKTFANNLDPELLNKLGEMGGIGDSDSVKSLISTFTDNFDPKMWENLGGFEGIKSLVSSLSDMDPQLLQQMSKGDMSAAMKLAQQNPVMFQKLMGMMGGGGLNNMDPGMRLRMMQQGFGGGGLGGLGGLDPSMLAQMMEVLNSNKDPRQIVEELGLGKIDAKDPKEAQRQAQALIAQMNRAISMMGAGMGSSVIPDSVLWVVVLLLFAGLGGCVTLLIKVRNDRTKKRDKRDKKGKKA